MTSEFKVWFGHALSSLDEGLLTYTNCIIVKGLSCSTAYQVKDTENIFHEQNIHIVSSILYDQSTSYKKIYMMTIVYYRL